MNTLNLIKKQINKVSALHDAQISHTAYRGVEYNVNCAERKDAHALTAIADTSIRSEVKC